MSKELVKPVNVLTEEKVNGIEDRNNRHKQDHDIESIVASHRVLQAERDEALNASTVAIERTVELSGRVTALTLALESIGMLVTGELVSGNPDKYLYTILEFVKYGLEEPK